MLLYTNYSYNYNYTTLHYTTPDYNTLDYTTAHNAAAHHTTIDYATEHNATARYTTDYITLHYTHYTTPQLQLQLQLRYTNCTTHSYNSTTLQLQLQLHYSTLHPAVVAATTATTPKNTTPTTFRSISGFALQSMHHNNSPLL